MRHMRKTVADLRAMRSGGDYPAAHHLVPIADEEFAAFPERLRDECGMEGSHDR